MKTHWLSLLGHFEHQKNTITFKGKEEEIDRGTGKEKVASLGHYLSQQSFQEGKISTEVEFSKIDSSSACEVMLYYDPNRNKQEMFNVGIGGGYGMFNIRYFSNGTWTYLATSGDKTNLKAKTKYKIEISVAGSRITLTVNDIVTCYTDLPFPLPTSQIGMWCMSNTDIKINEPQITALDPKIFVIMQFSEPYNQLYNDVIKEVCGNEFKFQVVRSDETYGPGLIISDVVQKIREAQIIIAEISPVNANVYYEVGYAHALNKPTILIADKKTELPFDISSLRALFYENSIGGKKIIEEELRKHLKAILEQKKYPIKHN